MAEHTPGPLFVRELSTGLIITTLDYQTVADLLPWDRVSGGRDAFLQVRANAALFAAAPDLLAALEALKGRYLSLLQEKGVSYLDVATYPELLDARAAIAKATGQQ